MLPLKPIAYKGNAPYLFISYAHKDSDIVLPIITRMLAAGYRVWYDEGIAAGSNWDEYISEHLNRSAGVLCFLSEAYIHSHNCRDELALTRRYQKSMKLIYIEDVCLSPGLRMRYGRIQALRWDIEKEDEFFIKLFGAEDMSSYRGGSTV